MWDSCLKKGPESLSTIMSLTLNLYKKVILKITHSVKSNYQGSLFSQNKKVDKMDPSLEFLSINPGKKPKIKIPTQHPQSFIFLSLTNDNKTGSIPSSQVQRNLCPSRGGVSLPTLLISTRGQGVTSLPHRSILPYG